MGAFPSAPVDADTASLLDLIDGDPIHERDRATVVAAILEDANTHCGELDPNRLRVLLTDERGDYRVYPAVVGATVFSLRSRGVLIPEGWTLSLDKRSGNSGKPIRTYRVITP